MAAIKIPTRDIINIEPQAPGIAEIEKYIFTGSERRMVRDILIIKRNILQV